MNSHGFASAVGLREISIGLGDRLGATCVSAKSNPKCKSDLIDLLKGVLFHKMLDLDRSII